MYPYLFMTSSTSIMLFSSVAASNSPPASIFLLASSSTTHTFLPSPGSCQSRWPADKLCSLSYLIQAFLLFCLLALYELHCAESLYDFLRKSLSLGIRRSSNTWHIFAQ